MIGDDKQMLNFPIRKDTHVWLKKRSKEMGMSMSALCNLAITSYVDIQEGMKVMRDKDKLEDVMKKLENLSIRLEKEDK